MLASFCLSSPTVFQCFLHALLMHIVHFLASVGLTPGEMNAEVAFKVIIVDRLGSVGHSVHGCRVHMSVILDQNRPALPAPSAVDALQG